MQINYECRYPSNIRFFFIAEEFVLDNVKTSKAKKEDDNMPNQIASLVEKKLKEEIRSKVLFILNLVFLMWDMYTIFYNSFVLSQNLPLLRFMLLQDL